MITNALLARIITCCLDPCFIECQRPPASAWGTAALHVLLVLALPCLPSRFEGYDDDDDDDDDDDRATTVRATNRLPPHSACHQLELNQVVTILSRPFWCWYDESTLSGTYVVAATTYNPTSPPTINHTTNEPAPRALLGIVPLFAFLP